MPSLKVEVNNILYATDLSENARYAFAYAESLANLYGAKITLLHVLPEIPDLLDTNVVGYISSEQWDKIKASHFQEARDTLIGKRRDGAAIKEVLDRFCQEKLADAKGEPPFTTDEILVKRGNPVEEILLSVEEKKSDLIVMGTHGTGTLAEAMLGSTARRVIRRSRIPVLVVRLPEKEEQILSS